MVVIDNIPHLSVKDLIGFGFTQTFLDKQTSLKHYPSVYAHDPDQPTRKEVKLIPVTGIPEATRIEKNLPTVQALVDKHLVAQITRIAGFNEEAYTWYLNNPNLKPSKAATRQHTAKSKAEQAHILEKIAQLKTSEVRSMGFAGKPAYYEHAIKMLSNISTARQWPSWKCTGLAGLNKKLKPFQQAIKGKLTREQAWESLINKRVNNDNASKIDADQQALLVQLYADANAKPTAEQVWSMYTRKAKEMIAGGLWSEKSLISASAVRMFLNKPNIMQMWFEARNGYQEYRNVFEPVTQRIRPTFANALWVIDGTPSHQYFQHNDKGKYFRWNLFPILDAHSWCVLGFFLSETENTAAVLGALRSACMVSGCMPYQVLYDNSSAIQSFRAQQAIATISVEAFGAAAGNARAKIIENFFHLFNQDVQRFRPGFTHNPFAKTLTNRANREALAKMVASKELPLAEQALEQVIEDLTIMNNIPRDFLGGQTPLDAYKKSVELTADKQRKFTKAIDIEAFYALPGEPKKVRTIEEGKPRMVSHYVAHEYEFTNRGIDITIAGKPCTYDIEDASFRAQFIGQRFTVRYEPNPERWRDGQPAELLLYLQGSPLQWKGMHMAALPKELFHMALADYRPGEGSQLRGRLKNKKEQRSLVKSKYAELIEHAKSNKTYTEVITANAFDKEVLQRANQQRLDQILDGKEYLLTQPSSEEGMLSPVPPQGESGVSLDRLDLGMDDEYLDGPRDDSDEDFN